MVQHVLRIDPDLEALGFTDPESLTNVGIEPPAAQANDGCIAQIALLSRFGMLQNNLNCLAGGQNL